MKRNKCKNYGVLCNNNTLKNGVNEWKYCADCLRMINYRKLVEYNVIRPKGQR